MHRFVWDLHEALPKELARGRRGAGAGVGAAGPLHGAPDGGGHDAHAAARRREGPAASPGLRRGPRASADLAREIQAERVSVAVAKAGGRPPASRPRRSRARRRAPAAARLNFEDQWRRRGTAATLADDSDWGRDPQPTGLRPFPRSSLFQSAVESADADPSPDAAAGFADRQESVELALAAWKAFVATEVPKANQALEAASLPPLRVGG